MGIPSSLACSEASSGVEQARGLRAVGEQEDRRRRAARVAAVLLADRRAVGDRDLVSGRPAADRLCGQLGRARERVADRGAAQGHEEVHGLAHERAVPRHGRDHLRLGGERDGADAELRGQVVEEGPQRRLRRAHPRRAHVLGHHRAGGVDREDDGGVLALAVDRHVRSRGGHTERGQGEQEERRRHVAAPRARRRGDGREHVQVRVVDRVARRPSLGPAGTPRPPAARARRASSPSGQPKLTGPPFRRPRAPAPRRARGAAP